MNVAITGASGFIGTKLSKYLSSQGYNVSAINRANILVPKSLQTKVDSSDVIINLAGASIAVRWTDENKQEILNSRVMTTRALVNAINRSSRPILLITTSAVGIYAEDNVNEEGDYKYGDGFLTSVCRQWEAEIDNIHHDIRVAITRFGIVLSPEGGMLGKILPLARYGIATIMGTGKQSVSWIDIDDLMGMIEHIIKNEGMNGIFNITSPQVTTQKELSRTLLHTYHPHFPLIKIHSSIVKLLLGEASAMILNGQTAIPRKMLDEGFKYQSPTIKDYFMRLRG